MNTSPEMINEAYQELQNTRSHLLAASVSLADANQNLKDTEAAAIINGVEGKNAEARKANLRVACVSELLLAETAEKQLNEARYEFEQASSSVDRVKMLMRYDELVCKEKR